MRRRDDEPTVPLRPKKEAVVKPSVELKLSKGERVALKVLTPEERDVLVDEMLAQVREDLAWIMAMEVAREDTSIPLPKINSR
jgi:hypothetical protein